MKSKGLSSWIFTLFSFWWWT